MKFPNTARLIKDLYVGLNTSIDQTALRLIENLPNAESLIAGVDQIEKHFKQVGLRHGPIAIIFDEESEDTLDIELRVFINGSNEYLYLTVVERAESEGNFREMYINEFALQVSEISPLVRLYFEDGVLFLAVNEEFMETSTSNTAQLHAVLTKVLADGYLGSLVRNDLTIFIAGVARGL